MPLEPGSAGDVSELFLIFKLFYKVLVFLPRYKTDDFWTSAENTPQTMEEMRIQAWKPLPSRRKDSLRGTFAAILDF